MSNQQSPLDSLKQQLKREGYDIPERMGDVHLSRFLRTCKSDVQKTKAMLISADKWRKDFGVEDIVRNFVFEEKPQVDKILPQYYHKTDKDGRPIYIRCFGKVDIDALKAITTEKRLLQHFVLEYENFFTERLPACSKAFGRPIETACTIVDLDGVSLWSFYDAKNYLLQTVNIAQERYPDCLGRYYIINPPWGFSTVWSVIKPWLDEDTVAKIDIVGSGMVKEKLLSQIPAENLPVEFGGTCRCVGGCSLSDSGPWNPHVQQENGNAH